MKRGGRKVFGQLIKFVGTTSDVQIILVADDLGKTGLLCIMITYANSCKKKVV